MSNIETAVPGMIRYTTVIFSSLSLLGALVICASHILYKRLQSFSFRMILLMSVFDIMLACATICGPLGTIEEEAGVKNESGANVFNPKMHIGNHYESNLPFTCKLQAAAIQFSIIASLFWTLCFAIHLFRITTPKVSLKYTDTHSYISLLLYILATLPVPMYLTYHIFDQNLVGVSSDFWCWIRNEYLEDWAWKMLYIEVAVFVSILLILYFGIKLRLKLLMNSSENGNSVNGRARFEFLRTVSGGLSSYLFAPFIAFIPAHFNAICSMVGIEWDTHVLSWYTLSAILFGVLHSGIYVCGLHVVRQSWKNSQLCKHTKSNAQVISEIDNNKRYMELV